MNTKNKTWKRHVGEHDSNMNGVCMIFVSITNLKILPAYILEFLLWQNNVSSVDQNSSYSRDKNLTLKHLSSSFKFKFKLNVFQIYFILKNKQFYIFTSKKIEKKPDYSTSEISLTFWRKKIVWKVKENWRDVSIGSTFMKKEGEMCLFLFMRIVGNSESWIGTQHPKSAVVVSESGRAV